VTFIQGRVKADNADDAAVKIREKHNEHVADLTIVEKHLNWFEYMLTLKEE